VLDQTTQDDDAVVHDDADNEGDDAAATADQKVAGTMVRSRHRQDKTKQLLPLQSLLSSPSTNKKQCRALVIGCGRAGVQDALRAEQVMLHGRHAATFASPADVSVLVNEHATKARVLSAIRDIVATSQDGSGAAHDSLVVFFAGSADRNRSALALHGGDSLTVQQLRAALAAARFDSGVTLLIDACATISQARRRRRGVALVAKAASSSSLTSPMWTTRDDAAICASLSSMDLHSDNDGGDESYCSLSSSSSLSDGDGDDGDDEADDDDNVVDGNLKTSKQQQCLPLLDVVAVSSNSSSSSSSTPSNAHT
jgi:hypothetical protein